ncbi:hypothetical protein [Parenemella sanctibonifatiensis]|uniref:Uncharacterized protein n=1 Tax=Parenemella sanctibonifatiensis TaxID=2016505 RepID=A0A255E9C4_9ACTN|nr:hypothetical protein [Parenemella sanctibonifatiensis]OYN84733.1 hypothetical protein CGZ92_13015 [Parenemella sanctibonifatiensis]
MAELVEITDDTGALTIRWQGEQVDSVSLKNTWQNSIEPADLGNAVTALVLRRKTQLDDEKMQRVGVEAGGIEITPIEELRLTPGHALALGQEMDRILADSRKLLAQAVEQAKSRAVPQPVPDEGGVRGVRLFRSAGQVVQVEIDEAWAQKSTAGAIAERLTEALSQTDTYAEAEEPEVPAALADLRRRRAEVFAELGMRRVGGVK